MSTATPNGSPRNYDVRGQQRAVSTGHRDGIPVARVAPARSAGMLPKLLAALAGLALLGGIVAVALSNRAPAPATPGAVTATADPVSGISPVVGLPLDGTGALTTAMDAPVVIDIYSDFSCPFCAAFEAGYADQILELAADPNVSLRFHPVSVLDRTGNGTGFSTMAGAILLETAAISPQHVWAMNDFLLTQQEYASQMSGADLVDFVNQTGVNLPPIDTIMANRVPLLNSFTESFHAMGATGVPFVTINGEQWSPNSLPWPNASLVDAAHAALAANFSG